MGNGEWVWGLLFLTFGLLDYWIIGLFELFELFELLDIGY